MYSDDLVENLHNVFVVGLDITYTCYFCGYSSQPTKEWYIIETSLHNDTEIEVMCCSECVYEHRSFL